MPGRSKPPANGSWPLLDVGGQRRRGEADRIAVIEEGRVVELGAMRTAVAVRAGRR